jgi:hypothetical protein
MRRVALVGCVVIVAIAAAFMLIDDSGTPQEEAQAVLRNGASVAIDPRGGDCRVLWEGPARSPGPDPEDVILTVLGPDGSDVRVQDPRFNRYWSVGGFTYSTLFVIDCAEPGLYDFRFELVGDFDGRAIVVTD